MAEVAYRSASRIFPGNPSVLAVDQLELDVPDGEFLVLVGPSGSEKSTALRNSRGSSAFVDVTAWGGRRAPSQSGR